MEDSRLFEYPMEGNLSGQRRQKIELVGLHLRKTGNFIKNAMFSRRGKSRPTGYQEP